MNAIKALKEFLKLSFRMRPDGQDIVDITSPRQCLQLQSLEIFLLVIRDDNRGQGLCHRSSYNNTTDLMVNTAIKLKYMIFSTNRSKSR